MAGSLQNGSITKTRPGFPRSFKSTKTYLKWKQTPFFRIILTSIFRETLFFREFKIYLLHFLHAKYTKDYFANLKSKLFDFCKLKTERLKRKSFISFTQISTITQIWQSFVFSSILIAEYVIALTSVPSPPCFLTSKCSPFSLARIDFFSKLKSIWK